MANRSRRRRKSYRSRNRKHYKMHRSNPRGGYRRRHHYRRNPAIAGFDAKSIAKLAGGGIVGVLGSKYLSQMVLQGNNAGVTGAAAQGVATLVLAWAAAKLDKDVATGVLAAGLGAAAWSLIQQYTGTGGSMSGLGDLEMARFLGDFVNKTLPMPANFAAPAPVVVASQTKGRKQG